MHPTKRRRTRLLVAALALSGLLVFYGLLPKAPKSINGSARETKTAKPQLVVPVPTPPDRTPVYGYKIANVYPHDRSAFTQGLVFEDGFLYESTGLNGQSTLRKVELETGKALQIYRLPSQFFGEGVTLWKETLVQLTWQSRIGFVYDKKSFRVLRQFTYRTEGWGITQDGKRLIMSDGSATLYFLDPDTLETMGSIQVRDQGVPVMRLNELEYINGEVYANVWQTDRIARIAPDTGQVVAWIDLQGLLREEERFPPVDVLNGIAYDTAGDRLFVTGKYWPKLFEIELVEKK
jgi:glutamine cyclotransferase